MGDSVVVEVRRPDGTAYDNAETQPIGINGIPGSRQILVWTHPGAKNVVVTAGSLGVIETLTATVQVNARTDGLVPPRLQAYRVTGQPSSARFVIHGIDSPGLTGTPSQRARPTRATAAVAGAPIRVARLPVIGGGGTGVPIFAWTFPNATLAATDLGEYVYDFTQHLDPSRLYHVFPVSVVVSLPNQPARTIERTVTVFNPYGFSKQRGVLQPPTVSSSQNATFARGTYRATFTVYNPEPVDLTLTSLDITPTEIESPRGAVAGPPNVAASSQSPAASHQNVAASSQSAAASHQNVAASRQSAADARPKAVAPPQRANVFNPSVSLSVQPPTDTVNVVLKAKTTTSISLVASEVHVPRTATGFGARYRGTSPNGQPIEISTHVDLPWRFPAQWYVAPSAGMALNTLVAKQIVQSPDSIAASQIVRIASNSSVSNLVANLTAVAPARSGNPMPLDLKLHTKPLDAVEGQSCEPDNQPGLIPSGLACLPTPTKTWTNVPGRFVNARKGDIIISPSDDGLISAVLESVWPPQWFSHSGIMTRNYDEITHSTAAVDRVTDQSHNYVGADGIQPDIVKYLWPGVITQTVDETVNGSSFYDADAGVSRTLGGFGNQETVEQPSGKAPFVQAAMVVHPLDENPEVRSRLYGIADFAWSQVGKAHYRFYCYSNPTIGSAVLHSQQLAPTTAKWAAGTYPTVCSSFIWMCIQQALNPGEVIEGPLEATDIAQGAKLGAGTPDGLYLYSAGERLAAGEVLNARLIELVDDMAPGIALTLTDIDTDVANQVLNSFATDWSDTPATESDTWRQTTDANAVSPMNLTFYDAPLYGGLQPLIYREQHWEEVATYTWQKYTQTGSITGTVLFGGNAVAGAQVWITETFTTQTASDGSFSLATIPVGTLTLNAMKVEPADSQHPDGLYLSNQIDVVVANGLDTKVTINLQLPPASLRRVLIDGHLIVVDKEMIGSDVTSTGYFSYYADLSPDAATHSTWQYDHVSDGDVLGRVTFTLDLQADNSVTINAGLYCYDQNNDQTTDFDALGMTPALTIPQDGTYTNRWMALDGENYAEVHFNVTNSQHQA